jgi:hypothetical protein
LCRKKRGERLPEKYILQKKKWDGGVYVIIWGVISQYQNGPEKNLVLVDER